MVFVYIDVGGDINVVWVEFFVGFAIGIVVGVGALSTVALLYKGEG